MYVTKITEQSIVRNEIGDKTLKTPERGRNENPENIQ